MLEGKLVRLRAIEPEDRARAAAWLGDPEVTRHLTYRYPSSDGDWLAGPPGPNGFANGVWLAIETKDGEHIGAVNLHRVHPEDRKAALGIVIGAKERWGRGYGGDAVLTMVRFAFREMNLNRVWLTVVEDHAAAIACYRRCGFQEEARLRQEVYKDGRYRDFVLMAVLRDELDELHDGSEGGNDA